MKLSDFLKNEVDGLSEKLVLEAAEADSEGNRMIMIRGTKFDTFKNIVSIAACAVLVVAIAVAALIMPETLTSDTTPGDMVDSESENETTQAEEYVPEIDLSIIPDEVYDSLQFAIIGSNYPKTSEDGEFWYIIRDGEAVISRYLGDKTEVTIPTEVDGIPVSMVQGYAELLSYTLSEDNGHLSSKEQSFHGCFRYTNVKKVTVPGSVKVGENAFLHCNQLETVILEEGIKKIGLSAFRRCVNLTSVTLSEGVQSIHPCAFEGCVSLAEITIPASVLDVGTRSFADCTSLEKVTFLSENHVIAKNAFEGTPWAENN